MSHGEFCWKYDGVVSLGKGRLEALDSTVSPGPIAEGIAAYD